MTRILKLALLLTAVSSTVSVGAATLTATADRPQADAPPSASTDVVNHSASPEGNKEVQASSPAQSPVPAAPPDDSDAAAEMPPTASVKLPPNRSPAQIALANAPAPVAPDKDRKTLSRTEFTSETPPGFSVGTVNNAKQISHSAVAVAGEAPKVWVFEDRILSVFQCGKKTCVNDASGVVYELVEDEWRATSTRLRPWSTLVYVKDNQTVACIKPVVVQHSGVKAYCYDAERSWRESYFIRAPKPEICDQSLRMIQHENNQHWLTELELPGGKIKSKIAVNPPFKMLCDYKGPIKPGSRATGKAPGEEQVKVE